MSNFSIGPKRTLIAPTEHSHSGGNGSKKAAPKRSTNASSRFRPDSVALLAHQLLTPLSTISAVAQSMIRRAGQMDEHDIRTRAEKIRRAGIRLTELIETIMAHTRIRAGVITPEARDFNLRALVQRVCRNQGDDSPSHPLHVDVVNVPEHYRGDPVLLEQALAIVLANAAKYSPADGPIEVTGQDTGDAVRIIVKDQGIGVLTEDLPHLMEPFYRGRNAQNMPGTGLGLSLAHHILDLHGGSLSLESQEGLGATVTITLPLAQAFSAGSGI